MLFDAAIFFLEALKQKILDCPENIFSPVKLPTLYPGYVLKGEVHHNMRRLKEEEQSVLVSVTLMKGITEKTLSNLCQPLTTHTVHERPNHATET